MKARIGLGRKWLSFSILAPAGWQSWLRYVVSSFAAERRPGSSSYRRLPATVDHDEART
jgi:hypothetical protein